MIFVWFCRAMTNNRVGGQKIFVIYTDKMFSGLAQTREIGSKMLKKFIFMLARMINK